MRRGAAAFGAIAIASTTLAHASPLIIDQQRVDQARRQPLPRPNQSDGLRGFSDDNGATQPPPEAAPASGGPLREVHISGSSLAADMLASAWRSRVGAQLNDATIAAISDALSAIYKQSDVALYSIVTPNQDLTGGVLDVRVIEGHISHVSIQTNDANAPDIALARRYAAELMQERPLRRATLERQVSLIKDIPGEHTQATLAPVTEVGGAEITLAMYRNRVDLGTSITNRGTALLGRTQVSADVSLNGMLRGGDHVDVAVTAPLGQNSFRYGALAYTTPIGHDGLTASANMSRLHTQPRGLPLEGDATAGGVAFSYPLLRGFQHDLFVSGGVDALNSKNATVGQVVDTSRVRTARAGLSFDSVSDVRAMSGSVFLSAGIDGLGARVDPRIADADFIKLAAQASWNHLYAEHFALRLNAQAQFSGSALPASEQMALGGDTYGRAFLSGIVQGDQGLAASAEAAFIAPEAWLPSFFRGSEGYVFVDAGEVRLNDRPILRGQDYALSSAGVGARVSLGRVFTLGMEVAHAVNAPAGDAGDDWRFVYTLTGKH